MRGHGRASISKSVKNLKGKTEMSNWRPFIGMYQKKFYDVRLANGEIVKHCWPNAGNMCAIDGSGREWSDIDPIEIRESQDHPADIGV